MEERSRNRSHGRLPLPFRALIDAILTFVNQLLDPPDLSQLNPTTTSLRKASRRLKEWQVMMYDGYKLEITTELSPEFAFATARLLVRLGTILTDGLPPRLTEYGDLWEKAHTLRFLLNATKNDMMALPLVRPSYLSDDEAIRAIGRFFICPFARSLEEIAADIECYVSCLETLHLTMEDIWSDAQLAARNGSQPYRSILSKWAEKSMKNADDDNTKTRIYSNDLNDIAIIPSSYGAGDVSTHASIAQKDKPKFHLNSQRNEYCHKPLPGGYKTRLLRLHPGRMDEPVYCTLVPVQDLSTIEFEAISYCWVLEDAEEDIKIFDAPVVPAQAEHSVRSPKEFLVKPDLLAALKHFRDEMSVVVLWIDAICINQFDSSEKAVQISAMPEIFNNAANVRIWLGAPSPSTDIAFDFVEYAAGRIFARQDTMIAASLYPKWKAVIKLMEHKYFTRRWLVQELALSRRASLHSGSRRISWPDFALVVAYLNTNISWCKEISRTVENGSYDETLSSVPAMGATVLVRLTQQDLFFRKAPDGTISERLHSLEYLVSVLAAFDVNDPRDTIYALEALASTASRLEVNYEKSLTDVLREFVAIAVAESGCVDIICRPWAPVVGLETGPVFPKIPSWMTSIENLPFKVGGNAQNLGRINGDSLVGIPGQGRYHASGNTRAEVQFVTHNSDSQLNTDPGFEILFIKGFRIATVGLITGRLMGGIIPRELRSTFVDECSKGSKWTLQGFTDQLWRTMIADRGAEGNEAPFWFKNAFHTCWPDGNYDLDTKVAINSKDASRSMIEFLDRVQSVTWNRKVFLTRSKLKGMQRLGLAPPNTQEGDTVCILYGCSVPVILRKVADGESMYHELIGECFLYGMMDGEALTCLTKEERTMEFEIR
ncbi:hypothetical protein ONS96_000794 [Cadophora gregata f. sp. sojae]|nr:hypothetical protein ONS96_000794 [Cadophora gregata f. sp. sojae]